jgi:hypothetical protein
MYPSRLSVERFVWRLLFVLTRISSSERSTLWNAWRAAPGLPGVDFCEVGGMLGLARRSIFGLHNCAGCNPAEPD